MLDLYWFMLDQYWSILDLHSGIFFRIFWLFLTVSFLFLKNLKLKLNLWKYQKILKFISIYLLTSFNYIYLIEYKLELRFAETPPMLRAPSLTVTHLVVCLLSKATERHLTSCLKATEALTRTPNVALVIGCLEQTWLLILFV